MTLSGFVKRLFRVKKKAKRSMQETKIRRNKNKKEQVASNQENQVILGVLIFEGKVLGEIKFEA